MRSCCRVLLGALLSLFKEIRDTFLFMIILALLILPLVPAAMLLVRIGVTF